MIRVHTFLVLSIAAVLMSSSPAFAAQQHLVSPSQLASTVADAAAKQDTNRAAVREALERPEVQTAASKLGLDLTRARAAVDTMSGADLDQAANAARQVNDQLVGGASSVTISTTTLIIVLLLVIILILAIK